MGVVNSLRVCWGPRPRGLQERQWSPKSALQRGGAEEEAENTVQNPLVGTNGRWTPDGFHRRTTDGVTALFNSLTAERDDDSRWEQLSAAVNDPARAFSTPEAPIRSPHTKRPSTVSNGGPNRARHSKVRCRRLRSPQGFSG